MIGYAEAAIEFLDAGVWSDEDDIRRVLNDDRIPTAANHPWTRLEPLRRYDPVAGAVLHRTYLLPHGDSE